MDTIEAVMRMVETAVRQVKSGLWWSEHGRTKGTRSRRGLQRVCEGEALMRRASIVAGRIRKKERVRKKYQETRTLTECFGIPWRVQVKK